MIPDSIECQRIIISVQLIIFSRFNYDKSRTVKSGANFQTNVTKFRVDNPHGRNVNYLGRRDFAARFCVGFAYVSADTPLQAQGTSEGL